MMNTITRLQMPLLVKARTRKAGTTSMAWMSKGTTVTMMLAIAVMTIITTVIMRTVMALVTVMMVQRIDESPEG